MNEFQTFSAQVHARFVELSKHELFVVGDDNRAFEAHYLAAFPAGTNPVYKTHTEHDCSCCKQFIRNLGNVVAIIDGKVQSVWDDLDVPYPYDVVSDAMAVFVANLPITDVFRTQEPSFGAEQTKQLLEDGSVKRWNHFHGQVAKRHQSATPDAAKGLYRAAVQVFRRGLNELKPVDLAQVRELIEANGLYRGEEHLPAVKSFQALQSAYFGSIAGGREMSVFAWGNAMEKSASFRNTVIGTLLQDLAEGKDFEGAVKAFEAKVAPANYKRPTALITPRMIQDATAKIAELDLESALERRFANIGDVTVNNVLWVDNSVKGKMKGGLEDLLMGAVKTTPVKDLQVTDISIDDFMKKVVPTAAGMKLMVRNVNSTNFMSLTAPVHTDIAQLFKWANNFAWSYNGNIADSDIRRAVQGKGGRVDGVLRFSHSWNYGKRNASLMDLHVFMPGSTKKNIAQTNDLYGSGDRVGWNARKHSVSGGVQDVDYTAAAPQGYVPVENITFPDLAKLKDGEYKCMIHNWSLRQPTEGGFKAEIEFEGQIFEYEVDRRLQNKEWVPVATVTLRGGKFSIEHHLPHAASSQDVWGVKTESFVKVNTLMLSPNYWDDNAVGNKHWFFVLDGCKNDSPARGIYNEFLRGDLEQHRKVFEVLGDKTKCPVVEDQLSGLGFSSTRGDTVLVQVQTASGLRNFNVTF